MFYPIWCIGNFVVSSIFAKHALHAKISGLHRFKECFKIAQVNIMITNFNTSTIFSSRRIIAHTRNSGSIISLKRLIALVLLMCAYTKIGTPVIKCVAIDVINLPPIKIITQIFVYFVTVPICDVHSSLLFWILVVSIPVCTLNSSEHSFVNYELGAIRKDTYRSITMNYESSITHAVSSFGIAAIASSSVSF